MYKADKPPPYSRILIMIFWRNFQTNVNYVLTVVDSHVVLSFNIVLHIVTMFVHHSENDGGGSQGYSHWHSSPGLELLSPEVQDQQC